MKFQTSQEFQISRGETNVNKMTESSEDIFVTKQGIRNDTFRQNGAFTNFDRQIENQIVKNQMLEDDTTNLAQHILFKQFKCMNGVEQIYHLVSFTQWKRISFKFSMFLKIIRLLYMG